MESSDSVSSRRDVEKGISLRSVRNHEIAVTSKNVQKDIPKPARDSNQEMNADAMKLVPITILRSMMMRRKTIS